MKGRAPAIFSKKKNIIRLQPETKLRRTSYIFSCEIRGLESMYICFQLYIKMLYMHFFNSFYGRKILIIEHSI
jgi:hypothetical protein